MSIERGRTFEEVVRHDMARAYDSFSYEQLITWVLDFRTSTDKYLPLLMSQAIVLVGVDFEYVTDCPLDKAPTPNQLEALKGRPLPISRSQFLVFAIHRMKMANQVAYDIDGVFSAPFDDGED